MPGRAAMRTVAAPEGCEHGLDSRRAAMRRPRWTPPSSHARRTGAGSMPRPRPPQGESHVRGRVRAPYAIAPPPRPPLGGRHPVAAVELLRRLRLPRDADAARLLR